MTRRPLIAGRFLGQFGDPSHVGAICGSRFLAIGRRLRGSCRSRKVCASGGPGGEPELRGVPRVRGPVEEGDEQDQDRAEPILAEQAHTEIPPLVIEQENSACQEKDADRPPHVAERVQEIMSLPEERQQARPHGERDHGPEESLKCVFAQSTSLGFSHDHNTPKPKISRMHTARVLLRAGMTRPP